jgi:hypothetical protein
VEYLLNRAQEVIKVNALFDTEIERRTEVVRLEMDDDSIRFAIQYADGAYYGQEWHEIICQHCKQVAESSRTYRTWKRKADADKQLKRLIEGKDECI